MIFKLFLTFSVCLCSSVAELKSFNPKVLGLILRVGIFFFLSTFLVSLFWTQVQILAKIGIFTTPYHTLRTYTRGSLWGFWMPPGGWGVAESGGNMSKLRNKLKLFSKKMANFELLKNGSSKSNILLIC